MLCIYVTACAHFWALHCTHYTHYAFHTLHKFVKTEEVLSSEFCQDLSRPALYNNFPSRYSSNFCIRLAYIAQFPFGHFCLSDFHHFSEKNVFLSHYFKNISFKSCLGNLWSCTFTFPIANEKIFQEVTLAYSAAKWSHPRNQPVTRYAWKWSRKIYKSWMGATF